MGTVERESGVQNLMMANPGMTESMALDQLSKNTLTDLDNGYKERGETLDNDIKKVNAKLNWYLDKKLTQQQEIDFTNLNNQLTALTEQKQAHDEEYGEFSKNYQETYNRIRTSPDSYFAGINKQRVVNGWANAYASNESVTMDLNPAVKEAND
jgi:hypothetical protein